MAVESSYLLAKSSGQLLSHHLEKTADAASRLVDVLRHKLDHLDLKKLETILEQAALLHDIGKANNEFQQMVRHQLDRRQQIRHEVLSAMLAIEATKIEHRDDVAAAVLGHHLKSSATEIPRTQTVQLLHQQLQHLVAHFGLPDRLPHWTTKLLKATRRQISEEGAYAKLLLMAADVCGSTDADNDSLISQLKRTEWPPALRKLVDETTPNELQQQVLQHRDKRVLVVSAPCGTGKTLAAWKWAGSGRVIFCYPTTITTTAGYLSYRSDIIKHSRADVDAEFFVGESAEEFAAAVDAVDLWGSPTITTTVDTVVGMTVHHRQSSYAAPAILAADTIIFDELHAYTPQMISGILLLIKRLPQTRFLLMTATLPSHLRQVLEPVADAFVDFGNEETARPKYKIQLADEPPDAVCDRTLWITNTVRKSIESWEKLGRRGILLHSRFRYIDRLATQQKLVQQFGSKVDLAVTTQLAEMSLDLSAKLLVSEVADIAGMIQRLGRLARRRGEVGEAVFYPPERSLPYRKSDIEQGIEWLRQLSSRTVSQDDLTLPEVEKLDLPAPTWVASFNTTQGPLRVVSSIRVLMSEDWSPVMTKTERVRKSIDMPVTRNLDQLVERRGNILVSNYIDYNKEVGARWKSN